MSLIRIYVHRPTQKVLIPTVCETEAGFYVEEKPVKVFSVKDIEKWSNCAYECLVKGNRVVKTPDQSEDPGSAVLEQLKIDKWSTFEKDSVMFTIHTGYRYTNLYTTGKGSDGMWLQSETKQRTFYSKTPQDWVVKALVEEVIQSPESQPKPTLLLGGPTLGSTS